MKMNNIMNKHKYYRVTKISTNDGNVIFKVKVCDTIFELIFGYWIAYKAEHKSLALAKHHIDTLVSWKIIKKKIVFKRRVK